MKHYCFKSVLFLGLVVNAAFSNSAYADFVNGDFETGDMTGWTITVGPMAEYTYQDVVLFDMNDTEPGGTSFAAQFSVGQANNNDTEYRYIDVTQQLQLVAGNNYDFQFDWASHNYFFIDNFDGGIFELIVDGNSLASFDTENIFAESTEYGTLFASFQATQTGSYSVGARISRRFRSTNNGAFILGQYLDNFSVTSTGVPEPTITSLLALTGLGMLLKSRSRQVI